VIAKGHRPRPRDANWHSGRLHDLPNDDAVAVVVVIVPFAGGTAGRCASEDEVVALNRAAPILPKRTCKHARGLNRKWVHNDKEVNGKEVDQSIARKAQQKPEGEMEGTKTAAAAEGSKPLA
jgi:hypothetical protein